jgi:hypothetical protein
MFGAFFFVPDFSSTGYIKAGKQALSKLVYNAQKDRVAVPIKPPVKDDLDDVLKGNLFVGFFCMKGLYNVIQ